MSTVTLQPLVADHAIVPHVIAMDLLSHIGYDSLIFYNELQVTDQYCVVLELPRNMGASVYQPTIYLFLRVKQAIIPHLKEGNQSYLQI